MGIIIVLVISVLLQFTAAFLALRLIRITGFIKAWLFISAAIFLMAVRRCITLLHLIFEHPEHPPNLSAELIALVISVFMVLGIAWIAPFFLSIRRSEKMLRETSQNLQTLIQSSPLATIVVDSDGVVKIWNSAAEHIFGWSEKEVLGYPNPIIPEEKQDEFKRLLKSLLEDKIPKHIETYRKKKDGSLIDVNISTAPQYDARGSIIGVIGMITDITERKRIENLLKESEERFRDLYENAPDGYLSLDKDAMIVETNQTFLDMFGYKKGEIKGKHVSILMPQETEEDFKKSLLEFREKLSIDKEVNFVKKDGAPTDIRFRGTVKKENDKNLEYRCTVRDISARKQAEKQLRSLYEIGKKLTSIISKNRLLPWIAEEATRLFDTDVCNYRIKEGDYFIRGGGTKEGMELMKKEKLKIGESLSGWIAREKKPLIIEDGYSDDPRLISEHREIASKYGFRSALGVPMCIEGRVVGVLNIISKKPREFTKGEVDLLSAFADHAAIAVENARLFAETIEKFSQFKALHEINKMLTSKLKMRDLLPLIAEQANRLLNADGCNFRLREGDDLVRSYGINEPSSLMVKERIKIGESLSGIIARDKKPLTVYNLQEEKRYLKEHRKAAKNFGFVSFLGVPMMVGGEVVGVIHIFSKKPREFTERDITLLSAFASQAAIAVRNAEYLEKLKEAQGLAIRSEKLVSVGKLAAGVAHEILNPLSVISGRTAILMMGDIKDENLLKSLSLIKEQSQRIAKISEALLKFSRQSMPDNKRRIDVNSIITDTVFLVEKELLLANIEVKKELDENLPEIIADGNQLSQVFFNLITNARDAMPDKGTITISTGLNKDKNSVLITIKDTGCGIPEENLAKVFDPFFSAKEEGTGLGLSICFGIIEDHEGKIWVRNNEDKGATFYVELPVIKDNKN